MLEIKKYGNKNFQHTDTLQPAYEEYGANDITIIFEGNTVRLRSLSGRVIFDRIGYELNQIAVYDVGGTAETFPNIVSLKQRLINLGYPFDGGSDEVVLNSVDWGNINGDITTQGDLVTYVAENSVQSVVGSTNIDVDITDPQNPVVSLTGIINGGTIT